MARAASSTALSAAASSDRLGGCLGRLAEPSSERSSVARARDIRPVATGRPAPPRDRRRRATLRMDQTRLPPTRRAKPRQPGSVAPRLPARSARLPGGGIAAATLAACAPAASRAALDVCAAGAPASVARAPWPSPQPPRATEQPTRRTRRPQRPRRPLRPRRQRSRRRQAVPRRRGGDAAARQPAARAPDRRRHEGLRADDRRDRAPDRRGEGSGQRRSATTARGRDRASDRHRGRQGPGDLQEQPRASRPASTSMASGCRTRWTACRTSPRSRSSPARSFTYEFVARTPGSHMYHSHHNATDQVGRGLLGAFIVQPRTPAERYDRLYGASQDIVWISNDTLGGFTINGRGFPATAPIVATARRHDRHPVHERGNDDAPVAPPRDADAGRRAGRLSARVGRVHVRHAGREPGRALGRRRQLRRARARGPSTATSSRTPRDRTGCTGWSPRSSSRMRQPRSRSPRPVRRPTAASSRGRAEPARP